MLDLLELGFVYLFPFVLVINIFLLGFYSILMYLRKAFNPNNAVASNLFCIVVWGFLFLLNIRFMDVTSKVYLLFNLSLFLVVDIILIIFIILDSGQIFLIGKYVEGGMRDG